MNNDVIKELIDKKVIKYETIITAKYKSTSLGNTRSHLAVGEFIFEKCETINNSIILVASVPNRKELYKINAEHVMLVDGMSFDRIYEVFGLRKKKG